MHAVGAGGVCDDQIYSWGGDGEMARWRVIEGRVKLGVFIWKLWKIPVYAHSYPIIPYPGVRLSSFLLSDKRQ